VPKARAILFMSTDVNGLKYLRCPTAGVCVCMCVCVCVCVRVCVRACVYAKGGGELDESAVADELVERVDMVVHVHIELQLRPQLLQVPARRHVERAAQSALPQRVGKQQRRRVAQGQPSVRRVRARVHAGRARGAWDGPGFGNNGQGAT
jgi:hypothetical protein